MEGEQCNMDSEQSYPVLLIPKTSTTLETNCQLSDDVFIHLNITSPDTVGNQTCIYSGYCNIKILKSKGINLQYSSESLSNDNNVSVILADSSREACNAYNDQQIWIDPMRSPFVYNHCNSPPPLEAYEPCSNHITIQQHNTYITQNVYNEIIRYSPNIEEPRLVHRVQEVIPNIETYNIYEEDELECGLFLSQLSEEIMNEKETKDREERKYIGLQTENEALKQLMSSDIQSGSKQQKTILFLGHNAATGQTIQSINVNDPMLECVSNTGDPNEIETKAVMDDPDPTNPLPKKKYQCNKCKQIFDKLTTFKQHMVGNHRPAALQDDESGIVKFMCVECGKTLKTQEKFEQHCLGHGDPELECNKCHKVFASKLTLRNHKKIHTRKHPCSYCIRTYTTASGLQAHMTRYHDLFMCESCPFICKKFSELVTHKDNHRSSSRQSQGSETQLAGGLFEDISDISNDILDSDDEQACADSVIATVMSNNIFSSNKMPKAKKHDKSCEVCLKKFDRVSDLKRHLIEHVVRSTLAKNPVDKFGALNIRCEVCQDKVFNRIDRYKAHLREHAKLTLYKCAFCDKSFSDSSNFSKHKKIHSTAYYQCDMCQRKFNSKKMIIQHMELHNKNGPVKCFFCDRVFHFESMLNKHIRCSHNKESSTKFKCRYCNEYYKSLKEKWDHEWSVHQVRKDVADCLICGARYRKYSELKKHCMKDHGVIIPPAKKIKANKKKRFRLVEEK